MGIHQNRWFIGENPIKMDDDWGYPHDLGNLHICNPIPVCMVPGSSRSGGDELEQVKHFAQLQISDQRG